MESLLYENKLSLEPNQHLHLTFDNLTNNLVPGAKERPVTGLRRKQKKGTLEESVSSHEVVLVVPSLSNVPSVFSVKHSISDFRSWKVIR